MTTGGISLKKEEICLLTISALFAAASAIGAGLADLLTAPMWVPPTLVIVKAFQKK